MLILQDVALLKEGWENKPFSGFTRKYLENSRRCVQCYY